MVRRASVLAMALCLSVSFGFVAMRSSHAEAQAKMPGVESEAGRRLWLRDCAVCHGEDGSGSPRGVSLDGVGAAGVDFQVSTGRMPVADPEQRAVRGPVAYEQAQIEALVRYTSTILDGPDVPEVDLAGTDLAGGGELYRTNCASCHQMAGQGGVLTSGVQVPALGQATPVEVVEAMRVAPNEMPNFPVTSLDEQASRDIAAYVEAISHPDNRGGWALGNWGPVPEGAAAFFLGLGTLVVIARRMGERSQPANQETELR